MSHPPYSSPDAPMNTGGSMAESIVSSFVKKLGSLIAEEGTFLLGVRGQLRLLRDELEWMRSFLKEAESKRRNSDSVEVWVSQIMDLAYDAEDVIDTYVFLVEKQKRSNFFKKVFHFGNKVVALHQLGKRVEQINTRAKIISDCRLKYIPDVSQPVQESSSHHRAENLARRRRGSSTLEESEIVGFTNEKAQLADWLQYNRAFPSRKVISVIGMGGLGKTALARVTFNRVSSHFDAKAWVTVSQEYEVRDILLKLLKDFTRKLMDEKKRERLLSKMEKMDNEELERELHKLLESKKYLVVIDDIWQVEEWESLQRAFQDNHKGGRILLTTRKLEVATYANPSRSTHLELNTLSKDDSWELFCRKVFSMPGDTNCPNDLIKLGKQIVNKCGGLPLAILVMGGLLMGKERTVSVWSKVLESATWHLSQDTNDCREILGLSYFDLPHYLRSCFLYLGLFPEDSEIYAHNLILLWVAEGFIQARGEQNMEDVAEDCLEELIQRSMIQVTARVYYGGPVGVCRVHDVLRDFAISEGGKNRFLDIQTPNPLTSTKNKARRMAVHSNINCEDHTSAIVTPELQSLLVFTVRDELGPDMLWKSTLLHGAKMLRVLELCDLKNLTVLPKEIGKLVLLRYLGLSFTDVRSLPSSIGKLVNLQTLTLIGDDNIGLPKALWKLKNIRHFCASIANNYVENTMYPRNTKSVRLDNFGRYLLNLEVGSEMYMCLSGALVKAGCLRSLKVKGKLSISGHQSLKNYFPTSLTDLLLFNSGFEQDPSDVFGSLPKLRTFVLHAAYAGRELVFSGGRFPQLQYLSIRWSHNLMDWRVEDDAVSNLRHVCISGCKRLKRLPYGLKNVNTLQKLEIYFMQTSFTARVKENGEDWAIIKHVPIITVED